MLVKQPLCKSWARQALKEERSPWNTYTSPIPKSIISPTFCLRGICNLVKIGRGRKKRTKSVNMLNGAFVKYTILGFMQWPSIDLFQKYSTGLHMNINPAIVHTRKAAMMAITTQQAWLNLFSENTRKYKRRMETFVRKRATEYIGTLTQKGCVTCQSVTRCRNDMIKKADCFGTR